jgi:hypothetical protein
VARQGAGEPVVGRVIGKGLTGDEMGERVYLVTKGVDGRGHQWNSATRPISTLSAAT